MKILVANVGSTSYKCRLIDMPAEKDLASCGVERVGASKSLLSFKTPAGEKVEKTLALNNHEEAVKEVLNIMKEKAVISSFEDIEAVGFKTVQAGDKNGSVLLEKSVTDAMEEYAPLAPAHNPPYLKCIYYFQKLLPNVPLVGIFEPGFHTNIPEYARVFGVPYEWYEKYGVKKYGYHGATFRYVTETCIEKLNLNRDSVKIIACHLGGSSSICAYKNGHSIDVSMSFSPQSGLIQSTRTGDLDPFVLPFVMEKSGKSLEEVLKELGTNGGFKGISGVSGDMRDVIEASDKGDKRSAVAVEKFLYDVIRYIGSYYAILGGVDVIAFSGGIGKNDAMVRSRIVEALAFMGIELDEEKNASRDEGVKTKEGSKIKIITVDTNEEIVVARETFKVVKGE